MIRRIRSYEKTKAVSEIIKDLGRSVLENVETPGTVSAICVKDRRKPLAKGKDYFCTVVSENVGIALKSKPILNLKQNGDMFVQCDQAECQYVDINRSPCPLHLSLFADEIETREKKRRDRRL